MKLHTLRWLCFAVLILFAGSLLPTGTSAALVFESTFYVTNINDSGPGSLREAILAANASPGADRVAVQVEGILPLESPLPVVTEDLRIEAGGYAFIIDGQSQYRIFEVPAGVRLELAWLELDSGAAGLDNGGAVWNAGDLYVEECYFLANFSELGGAIYNEGAAYLGAGTQVSQGNATQGAGIYNLGALTLVETSFDGNISWLEGGAVFNLGTLTVQDSSFSGGMAQDGAGIYTGGGSVTVTNSAFSGLETNHTGGAIYAAAALALNGGSLVENQSEQGGALYVAPGALVSIDGAAFEGNSAAYGGALSNAGALNLTGAAFTANSVGGSGGALWNSGMMTVTLTSLSANTAVGDGGGLHNEPAGSVTLESVSIQQGEARLGGAVNNLGTLAANSSSFDANQADWGAGIQNSGSLDVQGGQVTGNIAGSEGGGLYNTGALTLADVLVADNRGIDGAGMFNNGAVAISGGSFANNRAYYDFGGGIYNLAQGSLQIDGTVFSNNSVTNGGGAIFSAGALAIQNASFSGNSAKWGGAIHYWNDEETAVIQGTSFTGNGAGHWGGAILNDGLLELHDCTFSSNTGVEFSGALHNNGHVEATGLTFSSNSTSYGSGGAVENGGVAFFTDSTFENNSTVTNGGAISSASPSSELTLTGVTLSGNEAVDGGAIYSSGQLTLTGSVFSENRVPHKGGAVYNTGTLQAANSQFVGNGDNTSYPIEGGAIYNAQDASASFDGVAFEQNFAWYNGGAIASYGSLQVVNSRFLSNMALDMGGAIFQIGATASLVDTSFEDNQTWNYAGTLYTSSNMQITRCLLTGSYSWSGGAILAGGTLWIENSTLSYNIAYEGAAILNYGTTSLSFTTVYENSADMNDEGAALQNYGFLQINNSIIAHTYEGSNCYGRVAESSANIADDYSCVGPIVTDPMLGPLQDNGGPTMTHALLWGSPALNAATYNCPASDQRGVARPQGLACDLGAYEAEPPAVAIDIRPKSSSNLINIQGTGTVPVALLSTPDFAAAELIEHASLLFGATGWENPPISTPDGKLLCYPSDANADGIPDLVCIFPIPGAGFTCQSQVGIIHGALLWGDSFEASDLVTPAPCP